MTVVTLYRATCRQRGAGHIIDLLEDDHLGAALGNAIDGVSGRLRLVVCPAPVQPDIAEGLALTFCNQV